MVREDTNFLANFPAISILLIFNLLPKLLAAKGEQGVWVNSCSSGCCVAHYFLMNVGPPSQKSMKNQKNDFFVKIFAEKFGGKEKMSTFAIPNENNTFETQILVP